MEVPASTPVQEPLPEPSRRQPPRSAPAGESDVGEFERIMRQNNQRLYRLALTLVGDASEAEDVLQDSYVRAFRALPTFADRSRIRAWLSAIVHNVAMDYLRLRRARRNSYALESELPWMEDEPPTALEGVAAPAANSDPELGQQRAEFRGLLQQAVATLPLAYRAVFVLREIGGMSVEETAQYLDVPVATVKSRDHRARMLLRAELGSAFDRSADGSVEFLGDRCDRIVTSVLARLRPA